MVQGPWWKWGSGLRNEDTFGGMKTDCVSSKIIGTSRFAAIFQIIEKQYFEKLATKKVWTRQELPPKSS